VYFCDIEKIARRVSWQISYFLRWSTQPTRCRGNSGDVWDMRVAGWALRQRLSSSLPCPTVIDRRWV